MQRLGRGTGRSAPDSPSCRSGSFLMALHRCVHQAADGLDVVTSRRRLGDGHGRERVPRPPADQPHVTTAVLRRVLPYFCGVPVGGRVARTRGAAASHDRGACLAPRRARRDQDDVDRIAAAVGNPTRLVPWADISVADARAVETAVLRVVQLVEETSQRERVVLDEHLRTDPSPAGALPARVVRRGAGRGRGQDPRLRRRARRRDRRRRAGRRGGDAPGPCGRRRSA